MIEVQVKKTDESGRAFWGGSSMYCYETPEFALEDYATSFCLPNRSYDLRWRFEGKDWHTVVILKRTTFEYY